VFHGKLKYLEAYPSILRLTKVFHGCKRILRLTKSFHFWPKCLEANPSVSRLIRLPWGWNKYFMADSSTLRLTQVFRGWQLPLGWPKCFMADPKTCQVCWGWHKCFMAGQSTLRLTKVFLGCPEYPDANPSIPWLIKVPYGCPNCLLANERTLKSFIADPNFLRLIQVFHGWPKWWHKCLKDGPLVLRLNKVSLG
jgi:hypothetical protein